MKMRTTVFSLLLLVAQVGCNDEEDKKQEPSGEKPGAAMTLSDAQLESMSLMHLRACAVVGTGTYNSTIEDDFDRCAIKCMLDTPCTDLKLQLCSDKEPDLRSSYVKCTEACFDSTVASQYKCSDGSTIPHSFVCDLLEDCRDGEDEEDCGEHRCANGEMVPAENVRCDGVFDCSDDSDEKGCAPVCE